ncbi:MAG: hypothetical protein ACPGUV_07690 [Polyangiales bacterium]
MQEQFRRFSGKSRQAHGGAREREGKMMDRRWLIGFMGWTLLLLPACGQKKAPETEAAGGKPAAAPKANDRAAADTEENAAPRIKEDSFVLETVTDKGYQQGEEADFRIVLKSVKPWHLNQDFPVAIEFRGPPALTFPKATLAKEDASTFGDSKATFSAAFVAKQPGTHTAKALVSFALCTDDNCVPEERTLAVALQVR